MIEVQSSPRNLGEYFVEAEGEPYDFRVKSKLEFLRGTLGAHSQRTVCRPNDILRRGLAKDDVFKEHLRRFKSEHGWSSSVWFRKRPVCLGPSAEPAPTEFSLTQVWDRGVNGRRFFEEVIRENLDLGRPEQVQLIFNRKMKRSSVADGRYRSRILTEGVIPSLHVYFKNTHIKQYHKEGRALRTESTINNTYDFKVGRRLHNLDTLRQIGFAANRRVLEVEKVSHDCHIGMEAFERLQQPVEVEEQRASALRFGYKRVQALFTALCLFALQP